MRKILLALLIASLLLVGVVGSMGAQDYYQQFWSNVQFMYSIIIENDLTVRDDATITDDISVGGDLALTGSLNSNITQAINTYENKGLLPTVASASVEYTDTTNVFSIGAGEVWLVHAVYVNVTENYDCTGNDCTWQLGDGGDANGLIDLVDAEVQAAAVDVTGAKAGWMGFMSDTRGAYLADGDFVYAPTAAEGIDFDMGGTSPAGGAATVYIVYTRLQ